MTIAFEDFKARLLADPEVRAEYDALAPEFEIASELLRARLRAAAQHEDTAAIRAGNREQVPDQAAGSGVGTGCAGERACLVS
jgi:hypothetical protein